MRCSKRPCRGCRHRHIGSAWGGSYLDWLDVALLVLDGGEVEFVDFLLHLRVDHAQYVDCAQELLLEEGA